MTTEPFEPAPPPRPRPDQRGPATATVLAGAMLVLVGIGWLLDANGVAVPWRAVLPAALIAVGLATVAGSMRGRQHGLMVIGLVLTLVLALAVGTDWVWGSRWWAGSANASSSRRPRPTCGTTGWRWAA
jgi:hypothetical protein